MKQKNIYTSGIMEACHFLVHYRTSFKKGWLKMQYIIYCDESGKEGPYFSNFYGGALIRSTDIEKVTNTLVDKKHSLNIYKEIKWQRVSLPYLSKYMELMDTFFDLIEQDIIKVRIMFTQNYHQPINLTKEQRDNEYLILYYLYFKHAFGLQYSNPDPSTPIGLRVYFDELPVNSYDAQRFKDYIWSLQFKPEFQAANIKINKNEISEVKSNKHIILQFLDVILGAMYFRLNDFHKEIPEGKKRRGKRTIAKEKLYKHINKRIRKIYPGFNIGVSTGLQGDITNRWKHPYRHWLFIPSEHVIAQEYAKRK